MPVSLSSSLEMGVGLRLPPREEHSKQPWFILANGQGSSYIASSFRLESTRLNTNEFSYIYLYTELCSIRKIHRLK